MQRQSVYQTGALLEYDQPAKDHCNARMRKACCIACCCLQTHAATLIASKSQRLTTDSILGDRWHGSMTQIAVSSFATRL